MSRLSSPFTHQESIWNTKNSCVLEWKKKVYVFSTLAAAAGGSGWLLRLWFGDDAHFQNNVAVQGRLPAVKKKNQQKWWQCWRENLKVIKQLTPFGRWRKLCALCRRNRIAPPFAWNIKTMMLRFKSCKIQNIIQWDVAFFGFFEQALVLRPDGRVR